MAAWRSALTRPGSHVAGARRPWFPSLGRGCPTAPGKVAAGARLPGVRTSPESLRLSRAPSDLEALTRLLPARGPCRVSVPPASVNSPQGALLPGTRISSDSPVPTWPASPAGESAHFRAGPGPGFQVCPGLCTRFFRPLPFQTSRPSSCRSWPRSCGALHENVGKG